MALTALRVFAPFAAAYFLSYAYRNANAVIAPDLTADLGLTAAGLGLLTSAYFLTFAAFQLPLGVLLDRYGPRRVNAALLVVAAGGAFAFAAGQGETTLTVARALIGLGVSACLMASFKAFVLWFPPERLPLANGSVMAFGGLGALAVTAPLEALLSVVHWRAVFVGLGVATLASAALIGSVVPRRPEEAAGSSHEGLAAQWAGVRQVFSSLLFWRIVPLTTATHSAFLAFQGLWAGPWLADVAGLERRAVAEHLLLIPVAMVAGFFLTGLAAERLARRGVRTITVAVAGFVAFFLAQAALLVLPGWQPALVWCAFGFFGTTTALSYTLISRGFPSYLAGRANTGVNLIAFSGAFAAQWGVGVIIGRWPGEMPGSYDPAGYAAAIATVLGIEIACFAWLMWPRRDPRCRLS